ncbi:DMT family transporter [Microseira sp. BLCC-F43]|jgi:drug/metabolite transporter (DMT)-like permease|uniref:DMT family transporter n=1 Tax=Microseira sp. BLCC-F43 TaxID=3153602 RepID=UPI0035B70C90
MLELYTGELAALLAAFLWAAASTVYSRLGQKIPPLELNLLKGVVAIAFLIVTLAIQGEWLPDLNWVAISFLLTSGIFGIGIGDTAFFWAINLLGARRTLLLKTLTSPLVALLALIFLQETLTPTDWCGILLTLLGIAWVISERVSATTDTTNHFLPGISWAIVATFGDATGAILSRAALTQSNIIPMWSTLLRLSAGVLVLLLWLLVKARGAEEQTGRGEINNLSTKFTPQGIGGWGGSSVNISPKLLGIIAITSFFSTYLGIFLQQISLKFTAAGIAQTLGATSPLFVLPFAIWMGDKVSLRAFLGVLIALAGVWLLFRV